MYLFHVGNIYSASTNFVIIFISLHSFPNMEGEINQQSKILAQALS